MAGPSLQAVERINALFRPFPSEEMETYPVSRLRTITEMIGRNA
ncbi:MAG: hypothetical protein ABI618_03920 [Nitrospirota bacterium]